VSRPDEAYIEYLLEQLMPLGLVRARRMFGGYGLFLDGLMFGLVAAEELYLKVDEVNRPAYEARGLEPFSYTAKNRPVSLSYYRAPEEALEDSELLSEWAGEAFAAALRARQ